MAKDHFQFKQFVIAQDHCAMKVGTDALLLGAWVDLSGRTHALDIGTGTGVLSLMIAQRNLDLKIEAVEIDRRAAQQAIENSTRSKWSERISVSHNDIKDLRPDNAFDLIVSNPPYFASNNNSPNDARSAARQETRIDPSSLFQIAADVSTENALCALVYPFGQRTALIKAAMEKGWFIKRTTEVLDSPEKPPVRMLAEFSKKATAPEPASKLTIRNEDNSFHREYVALTKDFLTIF